MKTRKKVKRKRLSNKLNFPINVVYKSGKKLYRSKLSRNDITIRNNGTIVLPKNYYSKEYIERKNNIKWRSLPKKRSKRRCRIKNQHGDIIVLPLDYPGDNVVHQDLNPDRHKNIVKFDSDYFKSLYAEYRNICD